MAETKLPAYRIRHLPAEESPEGLLYAACFEELPNCIGQGASPAEAEAMAWRILPRYLERMMLNGQPIPLALGSGMRLTPNPAPQSQTAARAAVFRRAEFVVQRQEGGMKAHVTTQTGFQDLQPA